MTEAQLAAVRNPGGAVSTGDTLARLPARRGRRALAGSLRAVDCGPLAPTPFRTDIRCNTVAGAFTFPSAHWVALSQSQEG